jgi:hypothetical protein
MSQREREALITVVVVKFFVLMAIWAAWGAGVADYQSKI